MSTELRYCVDRIVGHSASTVTSYSDYETAKRECVRLQREDEQASYEVWDDEDGDVAFRP